MGGLLKQETPKWELIGEGNNEKRGSFRSLFLEKETRYKWELFEEGDVLLRGFIREEVQ